VFGELLQSQKDFDVIHVRFVNKSCLSQISFSLFGHLPQKVAFERVLTLDFSCSGKGEPLFGTGISLHFWHFATQFVIYNSFFKSHCMRKSVQR
jgi:hypothetical protein